MCLPVHVIGLGCRETISDILMILHRSRLITTALLLSYSIRIASCRIVKNIRVLCYIFEMNCGCRVFLLRHAQTAAAIPFDATCTHLTHVHAILSYALAIMCNSRHSCGFFLFTFSIHGNPLEYIADGLYPCAFLFSYLVLFFFSPTSVVLMYFFSAARCVLGSM